MRTLPKIITAITDTREKRALRFPVTMFSFADPSAAASRQMISIRTEKMKLDAGDYCFTPAPELVRIERKHGRSELVNNLFTDDHDRFIRALDRLADIRFPYLLLDSTPAAFFTGPALPDGVPDIPPEQTLDALLAVLHPRRIPFIWLGYGPSVSGRVRTGEYLIRLFLSHYMQDNRTPLYAHPPEKISETSRKRLTTARP